MKHTLATFFAVAALLLSMSLQAKEVQTITIYGKLDPRLEAGFMSIYRGLDERKKECTSLHPGTATRKVGLAADAVMAEGPDYNVSLPLEYVDEGGCAYEFVEVSVRINRKNDDNRYSKFQIISVNNNVRPIYKGDKSGWSGAPGGAEVYETTKPYFRIAEETEFQCKTRWYESTKESVFFCLMNIVNDRNGTHYRKNPQTYAHEHPAFGVEALTSNTVHVDILVDDEGCTANMGRDRVNEPDYFREVPPKSFFEKLFD